MIHELGAYCMWESFGGLNFCELQKIALQQNNLEVLCGSEIGMGRCDITEIAHAIEQYGWLLYEFAVPSMRGYKDVWNTTIGENFPCQVVCLHVVVIWQLSSFKILQESHHSTYPAAGTSSWQIPTGKQMVLQGMTKTAKFYTLIFSMYGTWYVC